VEKRKNNTPAGGGGGGAAAAAAYAIAHNDNSIKARITLQSWSEQLRYSLGQSTL